MALNAFQITADGHHTSLSPSEIDRELATMWKPSDDVASSSATRIVLGNVIWVGTGERFADALRIFQKVIPKYPCRLFFLVYHEDNHSPEVSASVTAQCFVPEAGKPPVCCEMIHLDFGPKSLRHIRGCVAPLLLPDLQTVLWRGSGVDDLDLTTLEDDVDRIFTLVSRAIDPTAALSHCLETSRPSVDLSWFRMAPIRDQVTAFFDDADVGFDLEKITEVSILVGRKLEGSHLPIIMGAMFVGWIGSRLNWKPGAGTAKAYHFKSPSGPVKVTLKECPNAQESNESAISFVEMKDANGEVFHLAMGSEGKPMKMATECPTGQHSQRNLWLSEMKVEDAIGMALNKRPSRSAFIKTAELAVPLIHHYCS